MNDYFNNPMMEMFKKNMENSMSMWSADGWNKTLEAMQNSEMYKNFNFTNWMSVSNKLMENNPWMNSDQATNPLNMAEHMKKLQAFADMHKLSLESAQAVLRRQAEIIQKHSTDLYKLMQNMVSSPSPEAAMSLQLEYVRMAFDSLAADFKELLEMYSKANIENFEIASCKLSEHLHEMNKAHCSAHNSCSTENEKPKAKDKKN